ncbi:MAG TPA: phosphatidate cytidylyltransferase, partial [Casimicrobiaceae bacterium]|nr:phosphatidate cytidylyltransferase [Casimicrobiaceae bacterium]
ALFALPAPAFGLVVLLIVLAAGDEWAKLIGLVHAARAGFSLLTLAAGAALLWIGTVLGYETVALVACGIATLFWIVVGVPSVLRNRLPASRLARAASAFVVLEGAFVAIVVCRAYSPWFALAAMAIVWIADTAAYFTGRRFGRHKLAPLISPGKTWEGAFGAIVAVAVYALLLGMPFPHAAVGGAAAVGLFVTFAIVLAALSIVGDLHESLLKRSAGVKDSGTLLPGHGGVLDRIDALLAAMPPAALAATMWLGAP